MYEGLWSTECGKWRDYQSRPQAEWGKYCTSAEARQRIAGAELFWLLTVTLDTPNILRVLKNWRQTSTSSSAVISDTSVNSIEVLTFTASLSYNYLQVFRHPVSSATSSLVNSRNRRICFWLNLSVPVAPKDASNDVHPSAAPCASRYETNRTRPISPPEREQSPNLLHKSVTNHLKSNNIKK